MKNTYIIPPPPPHFLKINDASTASHAENKCSTYHFRHGRRCLHAASSLYNKLEVQEYTRTYIFERIFALFLASSLYLHRLFPKGFFLQYTAHLLRRIAKSVHPCTLLAASFGHAEHHFSDRMLVVLPGSTNKNYKLFQFFMIYLK